MNKDWMKLDNAAEVYPLVESDYIVNVYRFSVTLDKDINKDLLLKALNNVIVRFPYYKVTLKRGFFWFYLETNNAKLEVYEDIIPCQRILKGNNNGYLFRVLYSENTISVEFNHILADGTACLTFLNTIVHEYLTLSGFSVSVNEWIKDINTKPDDKEFEDSHSIIGKKHKKTHNRKVESVRNVFHLKDRLIKGYKIINSVIDADALSDAAKRYNISITGFLTSIYLESMYEVEQEEVKRPKRRKPVAIQVPVNMRKRLDSSSMRNFSLFIIPYLYPDKKYSFEEIVLYVNQFFKEKTDINNLLSLMVQNYRTERSVKFLPLFLKKLVTPFIYKAVGVDTYSGTISNIGKVTLPPDMEQHVERINFLLGPCPLTKGSCSVSGYKDKIYITFGRKIKEAKVETRFFRKLVKLGVGVKIESTGDNI